MKLKKLTAFILSMTMLIAACAFLTACNGSETDEEPSREIPYNAFFDATKWEYMTNNSGASLDGGELPVSLADGSIRFYRANQAYELGEKTNETISFLLKATNDWSIWLNSSSKDNNDNSSYRLVHTKGELRLVLSSAPNQAAAVITSGYESGEWNRFDVVFEKTENTTCIRVFVNGNGAALASGSTIAEVSVENNTLIHTAPDTFTAGGWFVVKVWYANDYVQLKPVELENVPDVPVVAVIGDSVTEGAGAENVYLESYPAQMQKILGGEYNVVNFGMSGRTARTDLPADGGNPTGWLNNLQWQGVQALMPDIAIVNLGTNDSKTSNRPITTTVNFQAAYEHILDELAMLNPMMEIIVCTSAYAYSSIYNINNGNIEDIIVPVQRQVAAERYLTLIDLHEITRNKSELFPDGVHPNARGYSMFAEVIAKVVREGSGALTGAYLADVNARFDDPIS